MTKKKSTKYFEEKLLGFITEDDPMLAILQWVTEKMIKVEVAQKGKHSTERTGYLSGTRVRRFDTRMGTMYLTIPKVRKGGYVPFFVTAKKRSEQALLQMIQEAWVSGISTGKIERLAQSLGIEQISASQVSEINKGFDEMVSESEETCRSLFRELKARGVQKVWLCVSDAYKGLQAAIHKEFLGSSWQRCKVHFMRNILAYVGQRSKDSFAKRLKQIWLQPDEKQARIYAEAIMVEYAHQFPKAIECLENGLEDSLQYCQFDKIDHRKISSTNTFERLNREIRRRSRVVGIFPSESSYIRLVTSYLIEYEEEWQTNRSYISVQSLIEQQQALQEVA
ncbi:MAG: transposase [Sphaerochaetaceae bacterium]|nr:transposase [Sphaerochaetaceae bacterium]